MASAARVDPAFGQLLHDRGAFVGDGPGCAEGGGGWIEGADLLASVVGDAACGEAFAVGVEFVNVVLDDLDRPAIDVILARLAGLAAAGRDRDGWAIWFGIGRFALILGRGDGIFDGARLDAVGIDGDGGGADWIAVEIGVGEFGCGRCRCSR